jgi:hypothetical protein
MERSSALRAVSSGILLQFVDRHLAPVFEAINEKRDSESKQYLEVLLREEAAWWEGLPQGKAR